MYFLDWFCNDYGFNLFVYEVLKEMDDVILEERGGIGDFIRFYFFFL